MPKIPSLLPFILERKKSQSYSSGAFMMSSLFGLTEKMKQDNQDNPQDIQDNPDKPQDIQDNSEDIQDLHMISLIYF